MFDLGRSGTCIYDTLCRRADLITMITSYARMRRTELRSFGNVTPRTELISFGNVTPRTELRSFGNVTPREVFPILIDASTKQGVYLLYRTERLLTPYEVYCACSIMPLHLFVQYLQNPFLFTTTFCEGGGGSRPFVVVVVCVTNMSENTMTIWISI